MRRVLIELRAEPRGTLGKEAACPAEGCPQGSHCQRRLQRVKGWSCWAGGVGRRAEGTAEEKAGQRRLQRQPPEAARGRGQLKETLIHSGLNRMNLSWVVLALCLSCQDGSCVLISWALVVQSGGGKKEVKVLGRKWIYPGSGAAAALLRKVGRVTSMHGAGGGRAGLSVRENQGNLRGSSRTMGAAGSGKNGSLECFGFFENRP